jgi:hypothetical protein
LVNEDLKYTFLNLLEKKILIERPLERWVDSVLFLIHANFLPKLFPQKWGTASRAQNFVPTWLLPNHKGDLFTNISSGAKEKEHHACYFSKV